MSVEILSTAVQMYKIAFENEGHPIVWFDRPVDHITSLLVICGNNISILQHFQDITTLTSVHDCL